MESNEQKIDPRLARNYADLATDDQRVVSRQWADSCVKDLLEEFGYIAPQAAVNAFGRCARHVGNLEAILYVLGIPTEQVAPSVWQRALGSLPQDKGQRKRAIRELVARRFPHLSVTLKTADALVILIWATDKRLSRLVDWLPSDQQKHTNKTRRYNYANSK